MNFFVYLFFEAIFLILLVRILLIASYINLI